MKCSMPASRASSTTCWMSGRSTTVSISFGMALVAGRKRVPRPATGNTALRIFIARGSGWREVEDQLKTPRFHHNDGVLEPRRRTERDIGCQSPINGDANFGFAALAHT